MGTTDGVEARWCAVGIAVAMVLVVVPGTALGAHNSLGADVHIVQADEVDEHGALEPDVEEELRQRFHTHLQTPRLDPEDQAGERYTDCTPWSAHEDPASYEAGLRAGTACYVGLLDAQLEYVFATSVLLVPQPSDPLYPVNPAPGDEFCQAPEHRLDPACTGAGHDWYVPGDLAVDTDLLDGPITQAATSLGTTPSAGSGTTSLPFLMTPYVFLFGQPHPDNPSPSRFEAGSGPFGPDGVQSALVSPVSAEACGERTRECRLLTPADLAGYDRYLPADASEREAGRLCSYRPQFETFNPEGTIDWCGVSGDRLAFRNATEAGGLGLTDAPTWLGTLPGWFEDVLIVHTGEGMWAREAIDATVDNPRPGAALGLAEVVADEGTHRSMRGALLQYVAVNPKPATGTHPLWCVEPNLLASGDAAEAGVPDPGLYGTYRADAIDADVHPSAIKNVYQEHLATTYGPARTVLAPVETVIGGDPAATQRKLAEAAEDLPDPVADALARAGPLEAEDPIETVDRFDAEIEPGVRCTSAGLVEVVQPDTTRTGWVEMDARIKSRATLKDPTVTDAGLPAPEDETTRATWHPGTYSFRGHIQALEDANGNDEPDPCPPSGEVPSEDEDRCTWTPIWDANNPECQDPDNNQCEEISQAHGFEEAGLWFVLRATGPIVIGSDEVEGLASTTARTAVVGLEDLTAQNCVIGVALGFEDTLVELAGGDLSSLCGPADGEMVVIPDAMEDQETWANGRYASAVSWVKTTPTPSAAADAGLGAGDELCVHTYFRTEDGRPVEVTDGLVLQGEEIFTDCDPAVSRTR